MKLLSIFVRMEKKKLVFIEVSVFYSWVGGHVDEIIDKWHREKAGIINNYRKTDEIDET